MPEKDQSPQSNISEFIREAGRFVIRALQNLLHLDDTTQMQQRRQRPELFHTLFFQTTNNVRFLRNNKTLKLYTDEPRYARINDVEQLVNFYNSKREIGDQFPIEAIREIGRTVKSWICDGSFFYLAGGDPVIHSLKGQDRIKQYLGDQDISVKGQREAPKTYTNLIKGPSVSVFQRDFGADLEQLGLIIDSPDRLPPSPTSKVGFIIEPPRFDESGKLDEVHSYGSIEKSPIGRWIEQSLKTEDDRVFPISSQNFLNIILNDIRLDQKEAASKSQQEP